MSQKLKDILDPIESELGEVIEVIEKTLKTGVELIDESTLHLFQKGGKQIRAASAILCSGLSGKIGDGVIEMAAAAEIVHAATLVHDDIIDQAFIRRGDVTVDKKWGQKIAVLAGDLMYTEALNISVEDGNPDLFPVLVAGTRDMVQGELYQLQYSNVLSITKDRYFEIIRLKTASFLAACSKLGALKGGFNAEQCDLIYDFGLNLGYAFQIVDDTLDFIDDNSGKDSGNDFMDGKVTLPFLYLLENSTDEEVKLLKSYSLEPDDKKWEYVREKLHSSDAFNYSIGIAKEYVNKGKNILDEFPDSEYKTVLKQFADFFVDRSF